MVWDGVKMKGNENISMVRFSTTEEDSCRNSLSRMIRENPIPDDELADNLGLFLTAKSLSRIKFMDFLYQKTLNIHGVVMDFGTRWGQNLALFTTFRGMYEPFNRNRKIIGFDTFEGFVELSDVDGKSDMMERGKYSVTKNYEQYLTSIMDVHEEFNPLGHIKKYQIMKGDACETIKQYLEEYPETIVSLAYFDMDLYKPTKECLEAIKPHLTKGSIIGFDEMNAPECPGETIAVKEVFGLEKYSIMRLPITSRTSYLIIE